MRGLEVCGRGVGWKCVVGVWVGSDLLRLPQMQEDLQIRDIHSSKSDLHTPQRCAGRVWVGGVREWYYEQST